MNASVQARDVSLSPADIELLKALNVPRADEREVARKTSTSVPQLRVVITKLTRKLDLSPQETAAKEFSQLAGKAADLLSHHAVPDEESESAALDALMKMPNWQRKLAEVSAAIAKGVPITVDPFKLRPMPGQPRDFFPTDEQESLQGSLGMVGQVQDIIIRRKPPPVSGRPAQAPQEEDRVWRIGETEYEICDGERRWRGILAKKIPEIRAKLIEIDDEGAYLVAAVSNFNRVGHTTAERARNIQRLMKASAALPIEAIATMQGISVETARKLLATLDLPQDVQALMNPATQRARGQMVLGKMPSYELGRLAKDPSLHGTARDLATRYVQGDIKLPQLRTEVDRAVSRSMSGRDVIGERNQPARRIERARDRLLLALEKARECVGILNDLKADRVLSPHDMGFGTPINSLIDTCEEALTLVHADRIPKEKR